MKSKINLGDIFEFDTPQGKAYLHYIYHDSKIGRELIRVLPGFYSEKPASFDELAVSKEQYMIFFPLSAATKRKIVCPVGHYPADRFGKPNYMRAEHNVKGESLGWFIINTDTWQRELIKELTPREQKFSDWASWNDTLLRQRLVEGWNLDKWG